MLVERLKIQRSNFASGLKERDTESKKEKNERKRRDLLFKCCDPSLIYLEMLKIQTSNFACKLTVRDTKPKKNNWSKVSLALVMWPKFRILGAPISLELPKIQISYFACELTEKKWKIGQKGCSPGYVTYFSNFGTPNILGMVEDTNLKFFMQIDRKGY